MRCGEFFLKWNSRLCHSEEEFRALPAAEKVFKSQMLWDWILVPTKKTIILSCGFALTHFSSSATTCYLSDYSFSWSYVYVYKLSSQKFQKWWVFLFLFIYLFFWDVLSVHVPCSCIPLAWSFSRVTAGVDDWRCVGSSVLSSLFISLL